MKKLFVAVLMALFLTSCSVDDAATDNGFSLVAMPIESVDIPESFRLGETYTLGLRYYKPTDCYVYHNILFENTANQWTVVLTNTLYQRETCQTLVDDLEEAYFSFTVSNYQTYVFSFWEGKDQNGNDMYYVVEVPVIE